MFIDEKEPPYLDKVLVKMLVRIKHRDHCSSVFPVSPMWTASLIY